MPTTGSTGQAEPPGPRARSWCGGRLGPRARSWCGRRPGPRARFWCGRRPGPRARVVGGRASSADAREFASASPPSAQNCGENVSRETFVRIFVCRAGWNASCRACALGLVPMACTGARQGGAGPAGARELAPAPAAAAPAATTARNRGRNVSRETFVRKNRKGVGARGFACTHPSACGLACGASRLPRPVRRAACPRATPSRARAGRPRARAGTASSPGCPPPRRT